MLIVNEFFKGIDGEVNKWHQGRLTTFIRLAGCNIRCDFCDTKYAQKMSNGVQYKGADLFNKLNLKAGQKVTITGGEPLMQLQGLTNFCKILCSNKINVSIETNGSIAIPFNDFKMKGCGNINWIIDWKLPSASSGKETFLKENIQNCKSDDWIKFVIGNWPDYDYAIKKCGGYLNDCFIAFSPMAGSKITPQMLIDRLIDDNLWQITLNVQLHKLINVK